ncbi:peroxiredoxin family protein [Spirosoma sordidisoli]|nr:TlpA disulfide reductase family protein [Spirosoma sordidisoli]
MESKSPNTQSLFPTLDPTYQKLKQTYSDWEECVKGQKAPLQSFKTINGETYDAASLEGKIVVVNFWFMSCAPCRAEIPALNKLVEEYKGKNVLFIGFSTDKADRLKSAFFEQNRFDFKVVADAQSLARSFQVMSFPTTFVIDQEGVIRQAWIGVDSSLGALNPYYKAKAAIDNLLVTATK